ncbi:site-2 protease family protein [Pseudalkalibacillus hwajinpoensis]|uniref:site-2 protease family protein n=1 Tax=Guptibacillus hwajinpoensis TaxID=208199 RepID=UPI00325BB1BB
MNDLLMVILIISPLSLLLHEAGHTLAANIFTTAGVKLHLGMGPRLFTWKHARGEVAVNAIYFAGGMTISTQPDKTSSKVVIALSGPAMNLSIAALALALPLPTSLIAWVLFFNLWLGVTNLIPFKILGKESDGWTIMKAIFQKG